MHSNCFRLQYFTISVYMIVILWLIAGSYIACGYSK